jgi:hypothetical protein
MKRLRVDRQVALWPSEDGMGADPIEHPCREVLCQSSARFDDSAVQVHPSQKSRNRSRSQPGSRRDRNSQCHVKHSGASMLGKIGEADSSSMSISSQEKHKALQHNSDAVRLLRRRCRQRLWAFVQCAAALIDSVKCSRLATSEKRLKTRQGIPFPLTAATQSRYRAPAHSAVDDQRGQRPLFMHSR